MKDMVFLYHSLETSMIKIERSVVMYIIMLIKGLFLGNKEMYDLFM